MSAVPWFDAQRLLTLVNAYRKQEGLLNLELDESLCEAAQDLSNHQARINKMTHSGPSGLSVGKRLTAKGYRWQSVAENVGYGHSSLEQAMAQWINSPPHRKNLLGPNFTKFGAAAAVNSRSGLVYLTQEFAKPMGTTKTADITVSLNLENMLSLVNEHRLAYNATPLKLDQKLIATAQKLASFMASKGRLTWQGPDGESQADRAAKEGFDYSILGQNIAAGFKDEAEAMGLWMKNPANFKPLMDPRITRIGVAFALGVDGKSYWVQDFGRLQVEEAKSVHSGRTSIPKFTSPTRPSPMQGLEAERRIVLPNISNQIHRPLPMQLDEISSPPSPPLSPLLVTAEKEYVIISSPPASPVVKAVETTKSKRKAYSSLVDVTSTALTMNVADEPPKIKPSGFKSPLKKVKTFSLFQRFLGSGVKR